MALQNVFLFTGEEKYIVTTKINRVIAESEADEFNTISYDCEEVNLAIALQDATTPPFMAKKKVVIVKNPTFLASKSSINHDVKSLEAFLNNPMDSTILIIDASAMKVNEKSKAFDLLKKKAICNDTPAIDDVIFEGWFKRQFDQEHIEVMNGSCNQFIKTVGSKDLINAKTEVDKLISYIGSGGVLTKEIVQKVCTREIQNDIFSLTNSILSGNKEKIINIYLDLIALDNDVDMLINMVSKTVRDTTLALRLSSEGLKQNEIASEMGTSSGKVYYLLKGGKDIPIERCEDYICRLGELDLKIKSGQIDSKTGFEFFLFGI